MSSLAVFVDCGGVRWTRDDQTRLLDAQCRAERWLVGQASKYAVDLSFRDGGVFGRDSALRVEPLPVRADGALDLSGLLRVALDAAGLPDSQRTYRRVLQATGAHAVHAVMYVNAAGRSAALPYRSGVRMEHFLESCVIYRAHLSGERKGPSSIAHEILHLYGAWDLYPSKSLTAAQAALATGTYPNDIMVRQPANIDEANVGALTAWRIGWAPYAEWFEFLEPGRACHEAGPQGASET